LYAQHKNHTRKKNTDAPVDAADMVETLGEERQLLLLLRLRL
jgi:hypothetical protein